VDTFLRVLKDEINQKQMKHYADGKQTYKQLAEKINKSKRWVQQEIDKTTTEVGTDLFWSGNKSDVVLGMDATYWGRGFGVMLFRDINRRKNLYWKIITHETVAYYIQGIEFLQSKDWNILAVVCDGKRFNQCVT
jgi:hypothetical protein